MCLGVFPLGLSSLGPSGFLDLSGYFLPHFREIFNYYLLKYFLMAFLSIFFLNVGAFNIVSEVSEIVFISFNYFFLSASFISTYPLFCPSYSTIVSLQNAFDLSFCIIICLLTLIYFF